MTLYVAVVSHGHDELIIANVQLVALAQHPDVEVIIRDNLNSDRLADYTTQHGLHYLVASKPMGFGANNNTVFKHCQSQLGMGSADHFCLLNPDLIIEPEEMLAVLQTSIEQQAPLVTINLFQDRALTIPDLNIKRLPSLLDFAKGFILGSNPAAYDKTALVEPTRVDWASGAFLLFRADLYERLGGFDTLFFMYLEDVDICRRARNECAEPLLYLPQFSAIHLCKQENKRLLSRHFYWFLTSMAKYYVKHANFRAWIARMMRRATP